METLKSMTEEEFSKQALKMGIDKEWIDSCIEDTKNDLKKEKQKGDITLNLSLENRLYMVYDSWKKFGVLKNSDIITFSA